MAASFSAMVDISHNSRPPAAISRPRAGLLGDPALHDPYSDWEFNDLAALAAQTAGAGMVGRPRRRDRAGGGRGHRVGPRRRRGAGAGPARGPALRPARGGAGRAAHPLLRRGGAGHASPAPARGAERARSRPAHVDRGAGAAAAAAGTADVHHPAGAAVAAGPGPVEVIDPTYRQRPARATEAALDW